MTVNDNTNGHGERKKRLADDPADGKSEEGVKKAKTSSATEDAGTAGGGTSPRIQQEKQDETAQVEDQGEGEEVISTRKEQDRPLKITENAPSASPASPSQDTAGEEDSKSKRDERRMEINRQRAKEIRKRKKKMVEDMQKQIIYLTLENNKLRTQTQMQQAEISLLRNNSANTGGMLGNVGVHQLDLLAAQQQQQSFNRNTLLDNPTSAVGGASASLLAGLGHLPQTSLSPLGAHLGASSIPSQSQGGNHDPFSSLQNSALSRLSNPTTSSSLAGAGLNLPGSTNLQALLANAGNGNVSAFQNQQLANVLASQQDKDTNDALGMGGMIPQQLGRTTSADSTATGGLQHHDSVAETNHHQQISNLLANTSSEMKSNLLERLQSEESEARILSMIIEQQQKQKDGSM